MVISLVDERKSEIAALCRGFGIRRLDLFGSAATGAYDPATSDLDFIVDLGPYDDAIADRFLDFSDALEAIFGRPVDVITVKQIRNPYFRAEVNATRELLYDAETGSGTS
jgi:predicted nucleotidyltransferase